MWYAAVLILTHGNRPSKVSRESPREPAEQDSAADMLLYSTSALLARHTMVAWFFWRLGFRSLCIRRCGLFRWGIGWQV